MTDPYSPPMRPPSALPLVLAGAAFALTAYLVWDRWRGPGPLSVIEPRTIEARGDLMEFEKTATQIFEANKPSVAHIRTSVTVRTWTGNYEQYPAGSGSGFVWDAKGVIVTNYHVVQGHERGTVKVSLGDGREAEAKLIAASMENDIAILRLLENLPDLRPLPLGTSKDLKVGQAAFAIGNPFGFDHSFTFGVIGALNRAIQTQTGMKLEGLIQVDTAVNPGNSGGPLLDSAGRLIGMTTAIYSPSGASAGLGFAVPVDTITDVVADLLAGGNRTTVRGPAWIGIKNLHRVPLSTPAGSRRRYGILFSDVTPGTGASEIGLKPSKVTPDGSIERVGDVIVGIDGAAVGSYEDLTELLRNKRMGQRVTLQVLRGYPDDPKVLDVPIELK